MKIILNNPRFRSRIACFDFDWTMVKPKDDKIFPQNAEDWQWLRPCVPDIIKSHYKNGYGIYVFTNQSKPWKQDMIEQVCAILEIPMTICIAFEKKEYKPAISLYHDAIDEKHRSKVKLDASFMCGDAVGRKNDHSNADLEFAKAIGIMCIVPEDLFAETKSKSKPTIASSKEQEQEQEIVILMGYPGSGKSSLCDTVFKEYACVHGDTYKTSAKMKKAAKEELTKNPVASIVFDATKSNKKKRAEYIQFAAQYELPCRCVHVNTSMEESMARNNKRDDKAIIPRIAYSMYKKYFEAPTMDEGFIEIVIVN